MKVLVSIASRMEAFTIPSAQVTRLRERFPQLEIAHATDAATALTLIADAEVVFAAHLPRPHVVAARALRWIHSPAAGVGTMLHPEVVAGPVVLTNSRGLAADTIAEHALLLVLALFRQLPLSIRRQGERRWAQDEIARGGHRLVSGSRIVIVGLGAIGSAAAVRFSSLGARVVGVRRHPERGGPPGVEVEGAGALDGLLGDADVLVLAAPETADTREMIGAAQIGRLPADAVVVNVSRGSLIDEPALIDALQEHRLGGAALDVFAHEPLDAASPLWTMPHVLITPHVSGFLPDHWTAATDVFAANLDRYLDGRPLLNVVDKQAGY